MNEAFVMYFGERTRVRCDRKCHKAWGVHIRPKDADGLFYLDEELGISPNDPGTYEGGEGKPLTPDDFPNKWCVRECERCLCGLDSYDPLLWGQVGNCL